ncbi:hypothetical protein [Elizabethkingia miricola]|uniref:hypothetical protein n=1 Tax=Elizabethkingia miricola TaxID=172045 RepID=UPI000C14D09D|nr:hypothetical protein [Elizabethkingia miricola]NHQ68616.1 hypothetical protein [Elizabethkingia miricola]NHQ79355.1 hypothetical protein [Elizabethkingia miricola]PSL88977.1 hypothetical protein C7V10_06570 [Elizabethkingia miricola]QHQ85790.1 hypothetical protein FE632_02830 [Elizabethkingia miricola]UIO97024.1 hypothetical protein LYZ41_02825 [Elizabethkingia miricola]
MEEEIEKNVLVRIIVLILIGVFGFFIINHFFDSIRPEKKYYEITFLDKNVIRDSMIETGDYFQSGNITYYKTNIISAREITNNQKK